MGFILFLKNIIGWKQIYFGKMVYGIEYWSLNNVMWL